MRKKFIAVGFAFLVFSSLFAQQKEELPVFHLQNLTGINSQGMDFAPVMWRDQLVYTTEREFDLLNYGESGLNVTPYLNIQSVKVEAYGDSVKYSSPYLFSKQFFSPTHTGPIAFDSIGNYAILTQVLFVPKKQAKGKTIKPQLYEVWRKGSRWKGFKPLPFCDLENSYGHPALSPDGTKLFFAAQLPNGKGGKDIYYCEKKDSVWSEPINLGRKANTAFDEMYPSYFSKDTLFFSSNKNGGYGGLDIYYTVESGSGWEKPVLLDTTINSNADDFGVYFGEENTGYLSSNRKGGVGADDLYFFQVQWPQPEGNVIAGYFDFTTIEGDAPQNLKVFLMSEDGELLYETIANEKGEFKFSRLPTDKGFILKTDPRTDAELVLLMGEVGFENIRLASNELGEFVYRKLEKDEFEKLSLLYEDDKELESRSLSGQFNFKNIQGDRPDNLRVFLVDDNGIIVFSTNADSRGFFKFQNLPKDEHYMVKIEAEDAPLEMVLFSDSTVAELKSNDRGEFVYVKLSNNAINSLALLDEQDAALKFAKFYTSLTAQFRFKNDKKRMAANMQIEMLNAQKKSMGIFTTDSIGRITVDSLVADGNTYFRIAETDPLANEEIELVVLDIDDYAVAVLNRDKNRFFVYRPLPPDKTSGLSLIAEQDIEIKKVLQEISAEEVYFDLDDWQLKEEGKVSLQKLLVILNDQPQLKVEVAAHADLRGSEQYNKELTQKRAEVVAAFLQQQGIAKNRVITKYYGESSPIYACEDCTEEEHAENRRVEFRLY